MGTEQGPRTEQGSTSSAEGPLLLGWQLDVVPGLQQPPAPLGTDLTGDLSSICAKAVWTWHKEETLNFSKIFIK